jgi:hypothetical protein
MLHKRDLLFSEKRQVSFGEFGEKWECGTLSIVFSHERCYNPIFDSFTSIKSLKILALQGFSGILSYCEYVVICSVFPLGEKFFTFSLWIE